MLFDFHQTQNAKKPNSVHATYLIAGRRRTTEDANGTNATNGRDGGDVDMRSSPIMSSMPQTTDDDGDDDDETEEPVKETTILLVREEELQGASRSKSMRACADCFVGTRAQFDEETSIHVYSLEPGPIEVRGHTSAKGPLAAKERRI
jgi:DNA polymerase delta subunit 3